MLRTLWSQGQTPTAALTALWRRTWGAASQEERGRAVPAGIRIYAIGDIHGRSDLLDQVLARIDRHRSEAGPARSIEVFLGDYVDRGPDSRGVIERLVARMQEQEVVALCGNHEDLMRSVLERPDQLPFWARNGGFETLMSYGVPVPPRIDPQGGEPLVERLREVLPEDHRRFLYSLADSFACGDYLFVHAGIRPGVPLDQQSREDLLWIRDEFVGSREDFGAVVVHGHTPVRQVEFHPNRINLDTGAYITNSLSCLVLEDSDARLL